MQIQSKSRKWKCAVVGALVAEALLLLLFSVPHPQATPISVIPNNQILPATITLPLIGERISGNPNMMDTPVFWPSNTQMLFFEERPTDSDESEFVVSLQTPEQEAKVPLEPLTRHFRNDNWFDPYSMRLSPDGKLLLRVGGAQEQPAWTVVSLDGKQQVIREQATYDDSKYAWMPDSRHWAELVCSEQETYILIHSVDSPRIRKVSVPGLPGRKDIRGDNIFWVSSDGRGVLAEQWDDSHIELWTFPLSAKFGGTRKYFIAKPPRSVIADCFLAPQGTKLAWFARQMGPFGPINSIWVSDLDRGHTKQIVPGMDVINCPASWLRWTPDGKRICFRYRNDIWTVPVEI